MIGFIIYLLSIPAIFIINYYFGRQEKYKEVPEDFRTGIIISVGYFLIPILIIILANSVLVRTSENSVYKDYYTYDLPIWFFLQLILFLYYIALYDRPRKGAQVVMLIITCLILFIVNYFIVNEDTVYTNLTNNSFFLHL